MLRSVKMILVIVAFILLSIIFFLLLARFYPPLNRYLFGGEFEISFDDIQFWVKRVPQGNYYKVYARYVKCPLKLSDHMIFFKTKIDNGVHGSVIVFNPEDNKIYGGGSGLQGGPIIQKDPKKWELVFYYLGEGKIDGEVFKPIFPKGTNFTFLVADVIASQFAPADYITIYFPGRLKKLGKEELEKGVLAEIAENEDPTKKKR